MLQSHRKKVSSFSAPPVKRCSGFNRIDQFHLLLQHLILLNLYLPPLPLYFIFTYTFQSLDSLHSCSNQAVNSCGYLMTTESPEHGAHMHASTAGRLQIQGLLFKTALALLRNGCTTNPETEQSFCTYINSWASLTMNYLMGNKVKPFITYYSNV